MTHSLPFLLAVPVLLAAGLRPETAQAQCSRSARSHCGRPAQAESAAALVSAAFRSVLVGAGTGLSMSGSGDYLISKTHLEYAPQLGRHWRLASRLAYIGGSQPRKLGDQIVIPQSYRAVNLEQEIHWLPFGGGRLVEFGVGGGVFAGYGREMSIPQSGYGRDASGNRRYFYTSKREQGLHVGYIASLYADVALDPRADWRLGGRLALQNDTRANILPGGQLQLSRAL
ncbi:hypothetical protein [uncultured Hymenobacter sp.]|uniref:hypothetical protein n=1 Tax=uncultured Hymenobacter sp. TaxID=170016 RepID=UPI0035CADBA2